MEQFSKKNIRGLITLFKIKNYKLNTRPYELNIVGVRSKGTIPNKFDDKIYVFWKNDNDKWEGKSYNSTTDPGTYWLKNPSSKLGTAILKEGQYVDSYQIGLHQGKYEALTQKKPVTVIRDYDRNAILDFSNGKEEKGLFGINIHRSSPTGTSINVDKWSAGCQVFENGKDFDDFMQMAKKQKDLYGNNFTYTLIDERSYIRGLRRRLVYSLIITGVVIGGYIGYRKFKKLPIIPERLNFFK
jgi:hypothetical protein